MAQSAACMAAKKQYRRKVGIFEVEFECFVWWGGLYVYYSVGIESGELVVLVYARDFHMAGVVTHE